MSISISIKKALKYLAFYGLPTILDILLRGDFPWLGLSAGTVLAGLKDYLKHRRD